MLKGKRLESKIYQMLKSEGIYCVRLYDAMSMGTPNAPTQPADFVICLNGKFILIECKECKDKRFNLKNIRPSQWKAIKNAKLFGYKYFVIINNMVYTGDSLLECVLQDNISSILLNNHDCTFNDAKKLVGLFQNNK
jgi:Holliday junction resolvase